MRMRERKKDKTEEGSSAHPKTNFVSYPISCEEVMCQFYHVEYFMRQDYVRVDSTGLNTVVRFIRANKWNDPRDSHLLPTIINNNNTTTACSSNPLAPAEPQGLTEQANRNSRSSSSISDRSDDSCCSCSSNVQASSNNSSTLRRASTSSSSSSSSEFSSAEFDKSDGIMSPPPSSPKDDPPASLLQQLEAEMDELPIVSLRAGANHENEKGCGSDVKPEKEDGEEKVEDPVSLLITTTTTTTTTTPDAPSSSSFRLGENYFFQCQVKEVREKFNQSSDNIKGIQSKFQQLISDFERWERKHELYNENINNFSKDLQKQLCPAELEEEEEEQSGGNDDDANGENAGVGAGKSEKTLGTNCEKVSNKKVIPLNENYIMKN